MSECTHTLEERWNECSDGACPFCYGTEIDRLRARHDDQGRYIECLHKEAFASYREIDRLRAERSEANNQWRLCYNACVQERDRLRAEVGRLEERIRKLNHAIELCSGSCGAALAPALPGKDEE